MSATFRLSKTNKRVSQNDLRRLMTDHKEKLQKPIRKIDSPLAKYNDAGQLTCVLCKTIVKSDNVWPVHINTKLHKENIEQAKRLKLQTQNFTATPKVLAVNNFKRPGSPTNLQPKKIKGILKNSQSSVNNTNVPTDFFDAASTSKTIEVTNTPIDAIQKINGDLRNVEISEDESDRPPTSKTSEVDDALPEGFFDDPVMDAKARNIQYKDPIEEEWDKFQKEMKEETSVSAAIIAGEQEEATADRQIDEIDEQIRNWSRVLDLERKKEEAAKQKALENTSSMDCDDQSSDESDEFDEYLDWRAKKSYR